MNDYNYRKLPRPVQGRLEELIDALRELAGAELVSVVLHGSAARGDYRPADSDIDLIVVLEQANRQILERISAPLDVARAAVRVDAMILVESELAPAADVFPLLYADIQRAHVVLFGNDPFSKLLVGDTFKRLRIEQELRELGIRLRRRVIDARHHPQTLSAVVARKTRQARFPLRALLQAIGEECKDDHETVISKAARLFRVDPSDLLRPAERPESAVDTLSQLLTRGAKRADELLLEAAVRAEPAANERARDKQVAAT